MNSPYKEIKLAIVLNGLEYIELNCVLSSVGLIENSFRHTFRGRRRSILIQKGCISIQIDRTLLTMIFIIIFGFIWNVIVMARCSRLVEISPKFLGRSSVTELTSPRSPQIHRKT